MPVDQLKKMLTPREKKKRYRAFSRGGLEVGVDDAVTRYKKRKKLKTHIVEAPWQYVIMYALANAVLIAIVRIAWTETFGRPDMFSYHSELEKELQQDPVLRERVVERTR